MMARRVVFALAAWVAIATHGFAGGSSTATTGPGSLATPAVSAPVHVQVPTHNAGQTRTKVSGVVILTVTGLDPKAFPGGTVAFDRKTLEVMGPVKIVTSTIWTDGQHTFTGVPLKSLARALNLTSETVSLHGLNDYAVEMPLSEAEDDAPILAYLMDGVPMSVRDKGPIWIVYPYDKDPAYRSETAFARSVWQLDRIDVLR